MQPIDTSTREIMEKYGAKIERKVGANVMDMPSEKQVFSREYNIFREEALRLSNTFYERACSFAENTIKIAPKPDEAAKLQEAINRTHLNIPNIYLILFIFPSINFAKPKHSLESDLHIFLPSKASF